MTLEECKTLEDVRENFAYQGAEKNSFIVMAVSRIMTNDKEITDLEELEQISDRSIAWLKTNVNLSLPTIKDAMTAILQ